MRTSREYLQKYANHIRDKHYPSMPRVLVDTAKMESHFGGKAYGINEIVLPKWMLADKEQAKSTIRHELAHNILNWLKLPRVISHGKEFHQILRQIAPKTWRNDLHWYASEAITEARIKAGIKPREAKPMEWRYFTCGNSNCLAQPKHKYAWKRIPYYVKAGLFARCEDCGCANLVEIDGKNETFTSVH